MSPREAALKGSEQIGFTIISLTISLIAVLIPLLFMGDVVGRLFHEFAITLAATIVISAIVSLTLVPMLCAMLLKPAPPGKHGDQASGGLLFRAIARFYASTLRFTLDHSFLTLLVALGTFALTGYLYVTIPKGFFPGPGHRRHPGRHAGQSGDLVRQDGAAAAAARRRHPERRRRREPVLVHRRRRLQRDAQFRPLPHQPEAARRAQVDRERDHPPAAEGDRGRRRHLAVHAAGAGSLDRHRRQRRAIPVHPAEPGSRDCCRSGRRRCWSGSPRSPTSPTSPATCSRTAARFPSTSTAPPRRASA